MSDVDAGSEAAGPDGTTGDAGADSPNPPGCPATQPSGKCNGEKLACTYGCSFCSCSQGQWLCSSPGCFGGCSPTPPAAGSACGGCCGPSVGMTCDYACPSDAGTFRATCVGTGGAGAWKVDSCTSGGSTPGKVACGGKECDLDAGQGCCDTVTNDAGKQTCGPLAAGSFCSTGAVEECDEKADCTGSKVCCIQFLAQGIQATCMPTCITGVERYQVCKTTSECELGGPCQTHTCGAGETVQSCTKPLGCQ